MESGSQQRYTEYGERRYLSVRAVFSWNRGKNKIELFLQDFQFIKVVDIPFDS